MLAVDQLPHAQLLNPCVYREMFSALAGVLYSAPLMLVGLDNDVFRCPLSKI